MPRRFTFQFTPTSFSWLNAVEGFFAKLLMALEGKSLNEAADLSKLFHSEPQRLRDALRLSG